MWLNRNKGSFLGTVKTNTLKDCVTVFIVECYLFGFVWHCGEAAGLEPVSYTHLTLPTTVPV